MWKALSLALLPRIQNRRGVSFGGFRPTRYGSYEDGISIGLAVAVNHYGAQPPFGFNEPTFFEKK